MESKEFWKSKTLWINAVAIIGVILNSLYGIELDAQSQATIASGILGLINIILRLLTKKGLKK